jgi:hypothetical protein
LGHKYIDTTLNYARLYDGTVAADYYRAMGQIEPQLKTGALPDPSPSPAHLLTLVDTLRGKVLNEGQRETVQQLRAAIVALAGESGFTSTFPTAD